MKALLLGSIGVIVDSSELQLEAYNQAFMENGVDWRWDVVAYRSMLTIAGGKARMRWYADQAGDDVPADALLESIHRRKTDLSAQFLAEGRASVRPGVVRLIDEAKQAGMKLGWVTSTELSNLEASLAETEGAIAMGDFDVVTHRGNVKETKPDPAPWDQALSKLGLSAEDAVAIEDTEVCVGSALAAGLATLATPNSFSTEQDFSRANAVVDSLGDVSQAASVVSGQDVLEGGMVTINALKRLLPAIALAS